MLSRSSGAQCKRHDAGASRAAFPRWSVGTINQAHSASQRAVVFSIETDPIDMHARSGGMMGWALFEKPTRTHCRMQSNNKLGGAIYVRLKGSPRDADLIAKEMPVR